MRYSECAEWRGDCESWRTTTTRGHDLLHAGWIHSDNTSQVYQAPFLVASNMTVKAIAASLRLYRQQCDELRRAFTPNIASGTLVWSDEFSNSGTSNTLPNSKVWAYDTGFQCCGNNEQETYCAAGSGTSPCDPNNPNAYIDTTGILHITARNPSGTTYTSARMKTEG